MNIQEVIDALNDEWIKKLEQIREEVKNKLRIINYALEILAKNEPDVPKMKGAKNAFEEALEIIDKALKEVSNE